VSNLFRNIKIFVIVFTLTFALGIIIRFNYLDGWGL